MADKLQSKENILASNKLQALIRTLLINSWRLQTELVSGYADAWNDIWQLLQELQDLYEEDPWFNN